MTTAEKRIDAVEIEIIRQFFQYTHRTVGHFTDAEIDRMIELDTCLEAGKLTPTDASEYQVLVDAMGAEEFCFTDIDHLISDPVQALDRLEAAGLYP